MRNILIPAAIVIISTAPALQAQQPLIIFTLPKPTAYALPTWAQGFIMNVMKYMPDRTAVWRDEYKQIYEDREALKQWMKWNILPAAYAKAVATPGEDGVTSVRVLRDYEFKIDNWW